MERYRIGDLERMTKLTRRQIRRAVELRLVKPPEGRGPGATYDQEALYALSHISELRKSGVSDAKLMDVVRRDKPQQWRRWTLCPGFEVNVEAELERRLRIPQIISVLRLMLSDDDEGDQPTSHD